MTIPPARRMSFIALATGILLTACATIPGPQVFDAAPRSEPLAAGDAAPDFAFTDETGVTHRLSAILQDGPVVLYFYPEDFTPVCSLQAEGYAEMEGRLRGAGVQVIGVSPQGADSHRLFRQHYGLSYPLIPDTERVVIRAYGCDGPRVVTDFDQGGIGVRRVTYLIGQDGRIVDVLENPSDSVPHLQMVSRYLTGVLDD